MPLFLCASAPILTRLFRARGCLALLQVWQRSFVLLSQVQRGKQVRERVEGGRKEVKRSPSLAHRQRGGSFREGARGSRRVGQKEKVLQVSEFQQGIFAK